MKLVNSLFYLFRNFIDLLYPNLCNVCKDNLSENELLICVECKSKLPVIDPQYAEILLRKKLADVDPKVIIAYLLYRKGNISQQILYHFKYERQKQLGQLFGRWFSHHIIEKYDTSELDLIIPVPLHPKKMKKRGFNQSEILAREIARELHIPLLTNVLIRKRSSSTQTKKSRQQRMVNVKKIFDTKNENLILGKHILLVDDVITTGSTVAACSEIVKNAGAAKISIATLTAAK